MHVHRLPFLTLTFFSLLLFMGCQSTPDSMDDEAVEANIDALMSEMTLEEKIGALEWFAENVIHKTR